MSQKAKLRRESKGKVKITEAFGFKIGEKCILVEVTTDYMKRAYHARIAEFTPTTIGIVKAHTIIHVAPDMVLPLSWLTERQQRRREARQRAVRLHFEYLDAMTPSLLAAYQAQAFSDLQTVSVPLIPRRRMSPSMLSVLAGASVISAMTGDYKR